MAKTNLDRDANSLLLCIGGHVERWILDYAKSTADARVPSAGIAVTIREEDIRDAFQAFVDGGISDVKTRISDRSDPKPHSSLRAG